MLETNKKYWFKIVGNKREVSIKGEVLEENDYLVKIRRDDGKEDILTFKQILAINEAKEYKDEITTQKI